MDISVLGIDIAKSVFQLHRADAGGNTVLVRKVNRRQLLSVIARIPRCLIGLEACGGANYWTREFSKLGHEVRLVPARFVKPFVKSNKNDAADAEAISEAVTRPNMRFAPGKTVAQQDMQSLHRIRERYVRNRTALCNQIRGLLGEYGIVINKGIAQLRNDMIDKHCLESNKLSKTGFELFQLLREDLREIDKRIAVLDRRIAQRSREHPAFSTLSEIPGVGPLTASAIIGCVSSPQSFRNGRQFAAWVGLVPRQYFTGGKTSLGRISKRGNIYLQTPLVHGARTTMKYASRKKDRTSVWVETLKKRVGVNKTTVALANKNARVIWAMLVHEANYKAAAMVAIA